MANRLTSNQYYQRITGSNVVFAGLVGSITGLLAWLLNLAIQKAIIVPLVCRTADNFNICNNGGVYAWWIAAVVLTVASLFLLIGRGVYRPLLVILATLITVWGVWAWLGYFDWWLAALWQGIIFGLAYALYTLICRMTNFGFALAVIVVSIVIVRLVSLTA